VCIFFMVDVHTDIIVCTGLHLLRLVKTKIKTLL
jgi:hypothetical protein